MKVAHPECQILLLSAHAGTTDLLQTARILGHNFDLVSKPLAPKELLGRLRKSEAGPELGTVIGCRHSQRDFGDKVKAGMALPG